MKIQVIGWYNHCNVGDESYKLTFPLLFPQHTFEFSENLPKHENYDCVILGGGNVFSPQFTDKLASVKKPVYAMSVGIDRAFDCKTKFRHVYAREMHSLDQLKKMGMPCSFLPDFAFALKGNSESGHKKIMQYADGAEVYEKVVGIVVNAYMIKGLQENIGREALAFMTFAYELALAIDSICASFIFIPFGTELPTDDRVANCWVASKCKYHKKNVVIYDRPSVQDTMNIISACDVVVSSRLHSSIFAFNTGVPFVDITHHDKNKSFLQLINKEDCSVPFVGFNPKCFSEKVNAALSSVRDSASEKIRMQLKEKCNDIHFNQ